MAALWANGICLSRSDLRLTTRLVRCITVTAMAKNSKLAGLPGAKSVPVKPDYVFDETWNASDDEQKAYIADVANKDELIAAYGDASKPDDGGTPQGEPTDEGEKVSVAISAGLPTSLENETNDLAQKVTEKDREMFVEAVEKELEAKVLSVALILTIERIYGKGAQSLPIYGTTSKDSNNPDLRMVRKRNTSTGKYAKDETPISALDVIAVKAMVPLGLQSELKDLESEAAAKRAKETPVPIPTLTRISELRERRNKLISKFVNSVRLSQQLYAIGEMPLVGWSFISTKGDRDVADDMTNLTAATACIMLFPKDKSGNMAGMPMAVSPASILSYRVSVALENGGTLEELDKSPEPPTPEIPSGEEEIKIEDFDQAARVFRGVFDWVNKYFGPAAARGDATQIEAHLKLPVGSGLLAVICKTVEYLEEGVTSKPELKALNFKQTLAMERSMGGDANRQVKVA